MNNKKLGNEFEREFEQMLRERGFWVHFMSPNSAGAQPCDFIAAKNGKAYLIDCKTCVKKKFPLSRLEENQVNAFVKWLNRGNRNAYVAVKHEGKVYMVDFWYMWELLADIELTDDLLFERWIERQ